MDSEESIPWHISPKWILKKNLAGSVMVWISDIVMVMTIYFLEAFQRTSLQKLSSSWVTFNIGYKDK